MKILLKIFCCWSDDFLSEKYNKKRNIKFVTKFSLKYNKKTYYKIETRENFIKLEIQKFLNIQKYFKCVLLLIEHQKYLKYGFTSKIGIFRTSNVLSVVDLYVLNALRGRLPSPIPAASTVPPRWLGLYQTGSSQFIFVYPYIQNYNN